jgi:hypothetical protein
MKIKQLLRILLLNAHQISSFLIVIQNLFTEGQFDFSRPGNDKPVTGESLAKAVDAYLNSNETISPQYPSMGCNIKWKIDEEPDYFLEVKG